MYAIDGTLPWECTADILSNNFSEPAAYNLMLLSKAVYDNNVSNLDSWSCADCGRLMPRPTVVEVAQVCRTYGGFCASTFRVLMLRYATSKTIVMAFRGTISSGNGVTDMRMYLKEISLNGIQAKVHEGFWDSITDPATSSLNRSIHTFLVAHQQPGDKLLLTGHSLGGAQATLIAAILTSESSYDVTAVVTFGSPKVGNQQFVDMFSSLASSKGYQSYRVAKIGDSITAFPPAGDYVHVCCEAEIPSSEGLDHSISAYMTPQNDWMSVCPSPPPSPPSRPPPDSQAPPTVMETNGDCFPSFATVELVDGTTVTIDTLKEGDRILATTTDGSLVFDSVSLFSIADPWRNATFISFGIGPNLTLDVSAEHHLPVGDTCCSKFTKAKDIIVGDTLWSATVTKIFQVRILSKHISASTGIHSPVLSHGALPVINNIVTSFDRIEIVNLASYGMNSLLKLCKAIGPGHYCATLLSFFSGYNDNIIYIGTALPA